MYVVSFCVKGNGQIQLTFKEGVVVCLMKQMDRDRQTDRHTVSTNISKYPCRGYPPLGKNRGIICVGDMVCGRNCCNSNQVPGNSTLFIEGNTWL
jgi:hypothetical protein